MARFLSTFFRGNKNQITGSHGGRFLGGSLGKSQDDHRKPALANAVS